MSEPSEEQSGGIRAHRLFRVTSIYAVAGWLSIQVADILFDAFESPAWVMRVFLILVVAGLPLTLAVVWMAGRKHQGRRSRPLGRVLVALLAVAAPVAAYRYFWVERVEAPAAEASSRASTPVLAVLPFNSLSEAGANDHLADGLTEDIITLLAQSPGVVVIARNSTFKYKGQSPDIRDVGKDLGADYVVEGSVRPLGERIRITVQVIDAGSGAHVWAQKYDRPLAEFFEIQDEVTLGVAAAVGDAVFKEDLSRIALSRTENLTAWALISQAEMAFTHFITGEANGGDLARQAVQLDPNYALAHAMLGRALALNSGYYDDPAIAEEAEAEARLAARIDPDDPKVNAYLAFTLLTIGKPEKALPYAEKATRLSPGYAEGLAYLADILTHNGRSLEALPYFEKAIRLTPNAPQLGWYKWLLGEAYIHHGDFRAAEAALLEARILPVGRHPSLLNMLAGAQLQLGKTEDARASLALARSLDARSLEQDVAMWARFATDEGGPHFRTLYEDLQSLAKSGAVEPARGR